MQSIDVGDRALKLRLRCGACRTWRAEKFPWYRAEAVEARLKRLHRRERREIEADLRAVSLPGLDAATAPDVFR